ncbi:MAG: ABC-F family ATP-binding cassette domain-containing protein [Deltaproteobacteria bacterium]|nr:ABC-F family ATP-binding cassette domain-containing protein [Deltaproteobacteria bacterium]
MALLLSCQKISKAYGAAPLFADLSFGLHDGDRVGLVGPNGSGKSTLLRILAGLETPDSGIVSLRRKTRMAYVAQHPTFAPGHSLGQILTAALAANDAEDHLDEATRDTRVRATLGRCGFGDPDASPSVFSGGWQKRLAIAEALVTQPDVLLMDEPTNHLDLEGILWLEQLLKAEAAAFVVVSHDRWFLENVAERMLDLDPVHAAGFFETRGRYSDFLERKDAALREQVAYQATLANRVRREIEWLGRGPKARSTKSQARIDEAGRLIDELADVSARLDRRSAAIDFNASERKTRRLIVAHNIVKRFGERTIIDDLSFVLSPGTRLGLLGPNGSGKSTLIRLLTGELAPDSGRFDRADGLRIALLDQHRTTLDPSLSLRRALAPEGDQVVFCGRPVHVAGWARRFLFSSEQLGMSVGRLSGGEQARVLLASLMLQPADVLVLDEPTNDLDIPTLEVLEESLLEFPGAIVLVTHDRYLFERVTTTVLGLDGSGAVTPYADYRQWESCRNERGAARPSARAAAQTAAAGGAGITSSDACAARPKPKKLSWAQQKEWDGMEAAILAAEAELDAARERANDPAVASRADELAARCHDLQRAHDAVDRLYARWAELEETRG